MSEKVVDREDMCLHCRQDTKFGSGKFVNRYPAEIYNEELKITEDGYCCDDCETQYYKDNQFEINADGTETKKDSVL